MAGEFAGIRIGVPFTPPRPKPWTTRPAFWDKVG